MPKPALLLTGITKRFPKEPERRGVSSALKQLAHVAGLGPEPASTKDRAVIESVDLTLGAGEIALLVGATGCGKTSLLKMAAGLMRPTAGVVCVEGGSANLIYPRCGWHTALSGRDNLVLRALVDGLLISEAKARCERIARFADIEAWLDRPVREYSDVMLARLAFGVMAFLEARLLIWDDVLERRDPPFRQKCLGLIPTLLREGKAILMATHDMGKAEEIAPRAIWIDEGRVRADGASRDVLERYLEPRVTVAPLESPGMVAGVSRLATVTLLDQHGAPATCYVPGDPITVAIELELTRRVELPYFRLPQPACFTMVAALRSSMVDTG
jgi:ABC-type polysaccharide/polyol phosphate transport system ATPase subunit